MAMIARAAHQLASEVMMVAFSTASALTPQTAGILQSVAYAGIGP